MSAELLRRAAERLRVHAEAATVGPWDRSGDNACAMANDYRPNTVGCWSREYARQVTCDTGDGDEATADARYIALMHPPVAVALADALEMWAGAVDETERHLGQVPDHFTAEFALGRAILREDISAPDRPRRWVLPRIPDDVTILQDDEGIYWYRRSDDSGSWWNEDGDARTTDELVYDFSPLTEVPEPSIEDGD